MHPLVKAGLQGGLHVVDIEASREIAGDAAAGEPLPFVAAAPPHRGAAVAGSSDVAAAAASMCSLEKAQLVGLAAC